MHLLTLLLGAMSSPLSQLPRLAPAPKQVRRHPAACPAALNKDRENARKAHRKATGQSR